MFVGEPTCSIEARARPGGFRGRFLADAFRPFYLGGSVFAALAVALWVAVWLHGPAPMSLTPLLWHMHEMIFGFAVAIIVGFLFTAARNWTGLALPAGLPLAFIFGVWATARVGMLVAYGPATAVIDMVLLPLVAGVLGFKFVRAGSLGNLPLVAVLLSLSGVNAAFHGAALGLADFSAVWAGELGVMLVVLLEMIVGGRVVPGFTAGALPGVRVERPAWLQRTAIGVAALAIVADAMRLSPEFSGTAALLGAVAVGAQALGWKPWAVRGTPMLWVLHLSYAWIPVGLFLLGLSAFGVVTRSAAIHALAVGSMGGLIIGMITRTALGHTGGPVRAGRWEIVAYVLVHAAAAARVGASLASPVSRAAVLAAAGAWATAFVVYALVYTPRLAGRRRSEGVTGSP